jgi:uncharacterized protein
MNANNPMTPGVYTVEVNAFPPSVGQVPTAIPAFVGYTEMASNNGNSLVGVPFMINSISEFNTYFGAAPDYQYALVPVLGTNGNPPAAGTYDVKVGTNYFTVGGTTGQNGVPRGAAQSGNFLLYNCLQFFYLNGGGPAYIVSVGTYDPAITGSVTEASLNDLLGGLNTLPTIQFPKPTLILIPDGLTLDNNDYATLQQEMIAQAGSLMDRVAMLDIYQGNQGLTAQPADLGTDVISYFRDIVGVSNLDYAVAYYPWLQTSVVQASSINYSNLYQPSTSGGGGSSSSSSSGGGLVPGNAAALSDIIQSPMVPLLSNINSDLNNLNSNLMVPPAITWAGSATPFTYPDWYTAFQAAPGTNVAQLANQASLINNMVNTLQVLGQTGSGGSGGSSSSASAYSLNPSLTTPLLTNALVKAIAQLVSANGSLMTQVNAMNQLGLSTMANTLANYNMYSSQVASTYNVVSAAFSSSINAASTLLVSYNSSFASSNKDYANIMTAVANAVNVLPPASAMAGVYTNIDNTQGVWQSPANINLTAVVNPTVSINDDQQASLNVDVLAGKSINAIRSFYGRGPAIVWGARTLDGNSQDYRYINVRRTMIMIEQSIANAAFAFVFAPNDSTTWSSIQGMINNFLNNIWQSGGLQGAKPTDAYNVQVGLGTTMTSTDILNGIMRISVLVAVVRPAEFIIITYEQQMATS